LRLGKRLAFFHLLAHLGPVFLVWIAVAGAVAGAALLAGGAGPGAMGSPAIAGIPPAYLVLYEQAGTRFAVPWQVLAGIGKVESDHGRNPACYTPNSAGAVGPMQFLPPTFDEYASAAGVPAPSILSAHDSIYAAAAMLAHNGAATDIRGAVFSYNHLDSYVALVLAWARRYGWPG
jgi:hypothetical protein